MTELTEEEICELLGKPYNCVPESDAVKIVYRGGQYCVLSLRADPQRMQHADGRAKIPTKQALEIALAQLKEKNCKLEEYRRKKLAKQAKAVL